MREGEQSKKHWKVRRSERLYLSGIENTEGLDMRRAIARLGSEGA